MLLVRALIVSALVLSPCLGSEFGAPPNVILIITDDQGYGDIGAHGNSRIRTPSLDTLWSESVRLTDFHVDPTCSPTRSALLTGRYSTRTGVWHTIMGRSLIDPSERTLAEVFRDAGYRTAMFGKWHLGDNYPSRPQDQGFEHVVWHRGGGVGQGPDYWGNDYFDDTYEIDGRFQKFDGYCTDVWFREATRFLRNHKKDTPFFLYVSTNAPHGPYYVDPTYSEPYEKSGVAKTMARFYGMITNIDENVGRLRQTLKETGLSENTIFIFMTDNGTAEGRAPRKKEKGEWAGFNASMRGQKGSEYDGGHRVPFFVHWPAGGLVGGRDVDSLTAHIDVLPTLVDLCDLNVPSSPKIDGVSLAGLLKDPEIGPIERTLFVHSQRVEYPRKWRKAAVMTKRYRLVNESELYDVLADPAQSQNIAADHPEIVEEMRKAYDAWWNTLTPAFHDYVRIGLGGDENPVRLMSHDWHTEDRGVPWHQNHVRNGYVANGPWMVNVIGAGAYRCTLSRWPRHLAQPSGWTRARLRIGDVDVSQELGPEETEVTFEIRLEAGATSLQTTVIREDGKELGAYFVDVQRLDG